MARTVAQWVTDTVRAYWNPPLASRDPALAAYFGGGGTTSGEVVTEATALNFSAVWAAVTIISGDVASLPLFHYKRLPNGGKERMVDSRLYPVLHDAFNPEMSAFTARETMQGHVLTWGNAYAEIQRNEANQVVALWPVEPWRVQPYRETANGALRYRVARGSGRADTLPDDAMFHLRGLSADGIQGYPVIQMARESIGGGLAAQRFTSAFYGNGVSFTGFFEHPKSLGATAHANLRASLLARHQGAGKAGGFEILEEGMTFRPGSMPLKDAEFLETRKFHITEIARWFGIPPYKLADLERATFSNIEQEAINYVVGTLRRWLVRWEQEILRKLIPALERRIQFAEHLIDGLLRGDALGRSQALQTQFQNGAITLNEWREIENRNPLAGDAGTEHFVPLNLTPADRINEIVDAQVRPDPAPARDTTAGPDRARMLEPVETAVQDLQIEMADRLGLQLEQVATLLTAVHELGTGQLALTAQVAEVAGQVAAVPALIPVPEPPPPLDVASPADIAVVEARIEQLVEITEAIRTQPPPAWPEIPPPPPPPEPVDLTPVLTRLEALEVAVTARLATHEALRGWQEATIELVAGRLTRREIFKAKELAGKPHDRAIRRVATFYRRLVEDGNPDIQPWCQRLGMDATRVHTILQAWASAAEVALVEAIRTDTLSDLVSRWEIDRDAALTRVLMEALS